MLSAERFCDVTGRLNTGGGSGSVNGVNLAVGLGWNTLGFGSSSERSENVLDFDSALFDVATENTEENTGFSMSSPTSLDGGLGSGTRGVRGGGGAFS